MSKRGEEEKLMPPAINVITLEGLPSVFDIQTVYSTDDFAVFPEQMVQPAVLYHPEGTQIFPRIPQDNGYSQKQWLKESVCAQVAEMILVKSAGEKWDVWWKNHPHLFLLDRPRHKIEEGDVIRAHFQICSIYTCADTGYGEVSVDVTLTKKCSGRQCSAAIAGTGTWKIRVRRSAQ